VFDRFPAVELTHMRITRLHSIIHWIRKVTRLVVERLEVVRIHGRNLIGSKGGRCWIAWRKSRRIEFDVCSMSERYALRGGESKRCFSAEIESNLSQKILNKFSSSTHNGRFLMMYHDPTAAPMRARIKIGMRTAAVLLPPAECDVPKNFSQC
jgi:hypothetical protein